MLTFKSNEYRVTTVFSHTIQDFCVVGPKGCGKSIVVQQLADLLGYEVEPIMLYQD